MLDSHERYAWCPGPGSLSWSSRSVAGGSWAQRPVASGGAAETGWASDVEKPGRAEQRGTTVSLVWGRDHMMPFCKASLCCFLKVLFLINCNQKHQRCSERVTAVFLFLSAAVVVYLLAWLINSQRQMCSPCDLNFHTVALCWVAASVSISTSCSYASQSAIKRFSQSAGDLNCCFPVLGLRVDLSVWITWTVKVRFYWRAARPTRLPSSSVAAKCCYHQKCMWGGSQQFCQVISVTLSHLCSHTDHIRLSCMSALTQPTRIHII